MTSYLLLLIVLNLSISFSASQILVPKYTARAVKICDWDHDWNFDLKSPWNQYFYSELLRGCKLDFICYRDLVCIDV